MNFTIPSIENLGDIEGKMILLRLDLNVPVQDGRITDTYRIDQSIATIDMLRLKGAKIIIIAHSENKDNNSLLPMWDYLNGYVKVQFCPTFFTAESYKIVGDMENGDVMMFENVRINPGEKENDPEFAKKLSIYGEIYVNEAFSVSHRPHASVVGLPALLPHAAGPLFLKEIENLSKAFSPEHPFLFILGGAKFETKLPLIQKFLKTADDVFVGGALANDILKVKGYEIGTSIVSSADVSDTDFGLSELVKNEKFLYPIDVTVKKADGSKEQKAADKVLPGEYIGDCGSKTVDMLGEKIAKAKCILWNGPVGHYESGFTEQTEKIAQLIAQSSAESMVGGGDTLAAIESLDLTHDFSFVSTGGGAMLDFLANETLVGIDALMKKLMI